MKKVILITGASSGFGAIAARALADDGHIVYASMRETSGRNHDKVQDALLYSSNNNVDLRPIELDVLSQESADAAIGNILSENNCIDVIIHNAGHMVYGPAEAFLPEQFAQLYDVNVLGTQRVNRAILPHFRNNRKGLLLWVGSSSTRGGTPPYIAPYFAAKAAMDSIAVSYAAELSRWGIESSILVPGAFTNGTNHFKNSGTPGDIQRQSEYNNEAPTADLSDQAQRGLESIEPADANVLDVALAIVKIVNMAYGTRPFRYHVDPSDDGAFVVNTVADRIRVEFLNRIGLGDLVSPTVKK